MNAPAYRIDGRPAAADAFYAAACDPRRSVVVEACAGAGKTWMLVSRMLRALLDGAEPQQILAITFTRKAAGEMRGRLDEWLAQFAVADHATRCQALRERGLPAAEAAALAPALGALQSQLLQGGRAVEVRTFHGWFAQLVRHAPLPLLDRLGLRPQPELLEDVDVLRPELLRRFHRRVDADAALRADYLSLVHEHRRSTLLQWLAAAWQRSTELACAADAGTLDDAVPPAVALWPECAGLADPCELLLQPAWRTEIDSAARALGALPGARAQQAGAALQDALAAPDASSAWALAWNALFTGKGEPRKQLGDLPSTTALVDALQRVQAMRAQQAAHADHRRMARLSRVLLAEFAALKHQRGLADMADLERAALAMLGDSDCAGWLQERLDQRLRHVLIDEFQDTSPLQWQALHGWLGAYAGAGGGPSGQRPPSLFIVGDPKQSIYRFRRAEPRVFEAAREFVIDGLGGQVLECDHTRRNGAAVLAALNASFEQAAAADGWGPFRAHTSGAEAAGAVLALPGVARRPREAGAGPRLVWRDSLTEPRHEPDALLRQQEAAHIADGVAALMAQQGLRAQDVMVLSRKRAMLHLVAEALAQRGIAHVAPESLQLDELPEALDLAALLDVLASPAHDLSLARALKSPLFSADDAELLWLAGSARQGGRPWLPTLLEGPSPPGAALQRARALLARWLPLGQELPPHDVIDRIVAESELPARLAAVVPAPRRAAALQAVDAVLAAALEHDGGRYASLYTFVRALKAGLLRASPGAAADAVRLLTVHGAKGLEARAVFVADADPQARAAERATLLVDWPVHSPAPRRVAFVKSEARVPPSLAPLLAEEQAARQREELNGLYVAMTRAREWLVFAHTQPHQGASSPSWWRRVQALATPWVPEAAAGAARPAAAARVPRLPPLTWRPALAAPTAAAPGDGDAARLGRAVHRALEWLGQPGAAADAAARAAASDAAAAAFGVDAGAVRAFVDRILDGPETARFFGGAALRWAGNEVPLADADADADADPEARAGAGSDGVLRLDRLVLLEEAGARAWWVLDYKLNHAPAELPAHRAQMARYLRAVAAAQPGEAVHGAFISGRGDFVPV